MTNINENFLKLQNNYLFSTVRKKVEEYQKQNPTKKIINLGIGDVTLPIPKPVIEAMKNACDEMRDSTTFKGYLTKKRSIKCSPKRRASSTR